MKLSELLEQLEQHYAASRFRDYAPNGLQLEGRAQVKRVACSVSASLEAIETALGWGADALIVHHGLFWEKSTPCLVGSLKRRVELLLHSGISLLAYHLPMDAQRESGNNWAAAREMGWQELEPFGECLGQSIGVSGRLALCSGKEWVQQLACYYGGTPSTAGPIERTIERVALISGGAHGALRQAIEAGFDGFVTGSRDEPSWYEAKESGCLFVAVGHSASERIGPRQLARYLRERLQLESCFIEDRNPF